MEKPDYTPVHRLPVWLSSEDVQAAITRVGMSRGEDMWRACCWDMRQEIYNLAEATPAQHMPEQPK